MGVSSSSMVGAKGYSLRAQANKKFADSILTMMFKQTDFQDLLTLTNLSACPKYVFTTAQALSAMFTKMKVVPIRGKSEEIFFAPLSYLAPTEASVKGVGLNKERVLAARMAERNELCMEIAYFYIRIFQIYAALALTVMNADPVRVRRISASAPTAARGVVSKPGAAPFQSGGVIIRSTTDIAKRIKTSFQNSPFKYFDRFFTAVDRSGISTLLLRGADPTRYIELTWSTGDTLSGYYFMKSTRNPITLEITVKVVDKDEFVELEADGYGTLLKLYKIGQFSHKVIDEDEEDKPELRTDSLKYLSYRMQKIFEQSTSPDSISSSYSGIGPVVMQQAAPTHYAPSHIQVPVGKSVFEGFEQLKKIYASKISSPTFVFPKAYCIARAMTLMNPIFKEELVKPTDMPIVQVCSPTLDFEVGGDNYMPRARNVASANLYFKSFIALFYDSFKIGGGTIQFTQTENGKSKLIEASKLLAQLYRVKPEDQHKFLFGSIQFPQLNLCISTDSTKASPTIMYIKDPKFRQDFFTKNIVPMLTFQEQHTNKVNSLLKKLFTMKGKQLLLNPKLLAGGRVELNQIGYETHQLLLDYYLKSEAYYIKACIELNNNKGKLMI